MTIDKQKLQSLLWSEVAAWKADCGEWKQSTEALGEFLGEKTVEEVALELLAENAQLKNQEIELKAEVEALRDDAERYRGVRRVANQQGYSDEQFDQQTDTRVARFDDDMGKGEQP
ncbi:hypothetical protein M1B34_31745 [Pseudomonas sp. MAFF 302030]|uniref:Uncharacterized protein n=1 Tax=Pseudomonas morbosilactucae TaxID=2938197 RepID=A0A9X1Z6I6_9PSED|nr:hypothetical protein [Pseudomonas morbosilactucae]MCK9802112.1 hypothetical protein [Pseudomonas morbosilactucae]